MTVSKDAILWLRKNLSSIVVLLIVTSIIAFLTYITRDNRNDDAFITYRHAQNLLTGDGFVFNPGEKVLGTTAPFHGLILAFIGLFWPNIPAAAMILSSLSLISISFLIYKLFARTELPVIGFLGAILVAVYPQGYLFFPLETILVTALCLWAYYAFTVRNYFWMAVAGGFAIFARADSIILIGLLYLVLLMETRDFLFVFRKGLITAFITLPWFAYSWAVYGNPLSNTAATKSGWEGHLWFFIKEFGPRAFFTLFTQRLFSIAAIILVIIGLIVCFTDARFKKFRILPLWMAFYTLAYTLMKIFWPHSWYYYPLMIVAWILLLLSVHWLYHQLVTISNRLHWLKLEISTTQIISTGFIAVFSILLFLNARSIINTAQNYKYNWFNGGRDELYREVAHWMRENSKSDDRFATYEPGTIAYYSDRIMIDMVGLNTLGVAEEMKRIGEPLVSVEWTVKNFNPDYFIIPWDPTILPDYTLLMEQAPGYQLVYTAQTDNVPNQLLIYQLVESKTEMFAPSK